MPAKRDRTTTLTFIGLLSLHRDGDADDILHLSSLTGPFADEVGDQINGRKVSVRYWVTDKPATREEAATAWTLSVMGKAECDYEHCYGTEWTGYMYTNEQCEVGGHDLIAELKGHVGKWLVLEIDVHA